MDTKKTFLLGVMVLLIGLMLAGCAAYYSGYGYDYPYGYYDYGYGYRYHDYGHRGFGQSPKWGGERRGSGEHRGSGEREHDRH